MVTEEQKELLEYSWSDLHIDHNYDFFISDEQYIDSLKKIIPSDKEAFLKRLLEAEHKDRSYSLNYKGTSFRVEQAESVSGTMYSLRRMPSSVPSIHNLGYNHRFVQYMLSLSAYSGLILWAGPTGQGKTTAISSLLAEYLNLYGGFAYTIEDPAEMALEGEYQAFNGSIGLCKQVEVKNDDWGSELKSALRSKPRYIFIGEIRTPDAAKECLRAAISGHIVLASIHANSIPDAISSLIKYASIDISEIAAYDILSRGLLCVVEQELHGIGGKKHPVIESLFANPDPGSGCTIRSIIRSGKLNLATSIETQKIRMEKALPLF